jgi:hypothetical protein
VNVGSGSGTALYRLTATTPGSLHHVEDD